MSNQKSAASARPSLMDITSPAIGASDDRTRILADLGGQKAVSRASRRTGLFAGIVGVVLVAAVSSYWAGWGSGERNPLASAPPAATLPAPASSPPAEAPTIVSAASVATHSAAPEPLAPAPDTARIVSAKPTVAAALPPKRPAAVAKVAQRGIAPSKQRASTSSIKREKTQQVAKKSRDTRKAATSARGEPVDADSDLLAAVLRRSDGRE